MRSRSAAKAAKNESAGAYERCGGAQLRSQRRRRWRCSQPAQPAMPTGKLSAQSEQGGILTDQRAHAVDIEAGVGGQQLADSNRHFRQPEADWASALQQDVGLSTPQGLRRRVAPVAEPR